MKRRYASFLAPFEFSNRDHAELRRLLKKGADVFIVEAQDAAAIYTADARAEIPAREQRRKRAALEALKDHLQASAAALRQLDADSADWLDMGLSKVGMQDQRAARAALTEECRRFVRACEITLSMEKLKPPAHAPIDVDKRGLARRCAGAYQRATGKAASSSPNGTFARALLIVMRAAHAVPGSQSTVSAELLRAVLPISTSQLAETSQDER